MESFSIWENILNFKAFAALNFTHTWIKMKMSSLVRFNIFTSKVTTVIILLVLWHRTHTHTHMMHSTTVLYIMKYILVDAMLLWITEYFLTESSLYSIFDLITYIILSWHLFFYLRINYLNGLKRLENIAKSTVYTSIIQTIDTNILNQTIFFDPIAVPVHGQLYCCIHYKKCK